MARYILEVGKCDLWTPRQGGKSLGRMGYCRSLGISNMGRREKWKEMERMTLVLRFSRLVSSPSKLLVTSYPSFYLNMLVFSVNLPFSMETGFTGFL